MPRRPNRDYYPDAVPPRDWKEQVERGLVKYHKGLGPDDTGGLAPLASKMLNRGGMDKVVSRLAYHFAVATHGRSIDRLDTDDGDGVDLVDIIIKCVIFGKQPRKPEYDLKKIHTAYDGASPKIRDVMFKETMTIAKELLHTKGRGAPPKVQRNHLIVWLHERLRNRLGRHDYSELISQLLNITPWKGEPNYSYTSRWESINPETVRKKINELLKAPEKEQTKLGIERRLLKVHRITGRPDGRITN